MHFENASANVTAGDCEADFDDDDGLLADVDGGLLAEPPHPAIATEQTAAARTVRVTLSHGALRARSDPPCQPQGTENGLPITPPMIYL